MLGPIPLQSVYSSNVQASRLMRTEKHYFRCDKFIESPCFAVIDASHLLLGPTDHLPGMHHFPPIGCFLG
jgi:hypothetical protein